MSDLLKRLESLSYERRDIPHDVTTLMGECINHITTLENELTTVKAENKKLEDDRCTCGWRAW